MNSRHPVLDRAHSLCVRRTVGRGRGQGASALILVIALLVAPSAWAGGDQNTATEGGLGAAAAISSLVYGPLKLVYAAGGTTAAGFAWIFSGGDGKVAQTVATRSVRGTYVITPEMLQGQEGLEFVGRAPEYREAAPQVASAPEAW